MCCKSQLELIFLLLFVIVPKDQAVSYTRLLVPIDEDIFSNCDDKPDNNGIHELFDISELHTSLTDTGAFVMGNLTLIWDVEPTDLVTSTSEVFKNIRGSWQPTTISYTMTNLCEYLYDPTDFSYQSWSKYVPEQERVCFNKKGSSLHLAPFEFRLEIPYHIAGEHKIKINILAKDAITGEKRRKEICFEIKGEIITI